MIVVLKHNITASQKTAVKKFLIDSGFKVKEIVGQEETVLGAVGRTGIDHRSVELMEGVSKVVPISKPYKLASRELKKEDTIVKVGNVSIGGNRIAVIAGPCAVESEKQIMSIAAEVREAGAVILRGGAFKPRTSPYSFQGLGEEGLKYLRKAGDKYEMPIATEVVSPMDVEMMSHYVDMFQIGARNMQNFELLKTVGRTGMPVLLKRGLAATIEEWLMAAEYLMANGTDQIVLCERGIRTYERATRNTLDCSAIPIVQKLTHLPVIGDPSHATGIRDLVAPMSLALIASGSSGLIVEVHNHPEAALSDGPQSLYPSQFEKLMRDVQTMAPVVGKSLERIPRMLPKGLEEKGKAADLSSMVVSFQGERGAFSELAVRRTFDENAAVLPLKAFEDVFESVMKGDATFGVVPIENTLGGTIFDNIDNLLKYPGIQVVGEQQIRVIHNLIALPSATKDQIKKVYSHPQGLAQCEAYLHNELPQAEAVPFFDTAGAVAFIKKQDDPSLAAIAGAPAAAYYGMKILAQGIESHPSNYTRFYVLSRTENAAFFRSSSNPDKAAMTFSVSDTPGALFEALKVLSQRGLNLKKLESRPIPGKPWEYSFFVETELKDQQIFEQACKEMQQQCTSFRVLGTFKSAE
ncbi:MAG: 3-deoxy-7-phosphoheptulonate synthase [Spirochaetia bacterium]|jgi:3-deoxy-7-phosphoheptulonate synthase|nr:3-deoxy-7-phosphoheptulonate synthase [Spirochaetia bacterium]